MTTTRSRRTRATAAKRPISVTAVVDCVGALASRATSGHLYLYDTNKAGGSSGQGTEALRTRVKAGDELIWTCLALECEAYVAIDGIDIDPDICEPERRVFPGTDVVYWTGTVKKDAESPVPYRIDFRLGTRDEPVPTAVSPVLVSKEEGR
ncbi:hypothetical protein [Streptomyces sp. TRM64462]|uniref:hypothetical protein n=1 Tax=Streptomyces sp. TRM64462 TaxID=2741726 RepID=UPI0015862BAE|nr:hypothetical protein [Streptomyces sp. TRM64462]